MIDLSKEVNNILIGFVSDVEKAVMKIEDEVADEAVEKLKQTSPRKAKGKMAGHYAKSWGVDKRMKKHYMHTVVCNEDYRLTHLLENGHDVVRNGKVVGHAKAQVHIKPVEEWVKREMVERTREVL